MVDFLALKAAMTLPLAHLHSEHSSDAQNPLAQQYFTDQAMIEQVHEHMKEVNRLNTDVLSAQSADLLRRLLLVKVNSSGDSLHCARRVSVHGAGSETVLPEPDDSTIVVHIPYFGIIKIAREGLSRQILRSQPIAARAFVTKAMLPANSSKGNTNALQSSIGVNDDPTTFLPSYFQNDLLESLLQQAEYPGLTAVREEWAFQGVVMVFFDTLMRFDNEVNEDQVE